MRASFLMGFVAVIMAGTSFAQTPSPEPQSVRCEELDPPRSTYWTDMSYVAVAAENQEDCHEDLAAAVTAHKGQKANECINIDLGSPFAAHDSPNTSYSPPVWTCGVWVETLCCLGIIESPSGEPEPTETPSESPSPS